MITFKKKWISYILWTIAMVITVIMAVQYAFLFGIDFLLASDSDFMNKMLSGNTMLYDVALLGWIILFLAGTIGIYFALWAIINQIQKRLTVKPIVVGVLNILGWLLILIAAIVYRLYLSLASEVIILNDTSFYDAAVLAVTEDANLYMMGVHGASYAYASILSFVMKLIGARTLSVVIVQIVIQMLTILFMGAFVKRIFSYSAGLFTAAIMAFIPLYTDELFSANPGCFVALIFVYASYMMSRFRFMKNNGFRKVVAVLVGIVTGYLIYLDILAAAFLIVWLVLMINEIADPNRKHVVFPYILILIGLVLGLALSFGIDGAFTADGVLIAAQTWAKVVYTTPLPELSLMDSLLDTLCVPLCLCLTGFALFTLYSFFRKDDIEYELCWMLALALALTPLTKMGYLHDATLSLIIYIMYAGVGISTLFYKAPRKKKATSSQTDKKKAKEDKTNASIDADADNKTEVSNVVTSEQTSETIPVEQNDTEDYISEDINTQMAKNLDAKEDDIDYSKITSVMDLPFWNDDKEDTNHDLRIENSDSDSDKEPQSDMVINMNKGYSIVLEGVEDTVEESLPAEEAKSSVEESLPAEETKSSVEEPLPAEEAKSSVEEALHVEDERNNSEESLNVENVNNPVQESVLENNNEKSVDDSLTKVEPVKTSSTNCEKESAITEQTESVIDSDTSTGQVDDLPGMIPNPLPLPAKKPHAEINFNKPVEDDDLYFDIDIEDDDDFDI